MLLTYLDDQKSVRISSATGKERPELSTVVSRRLRSGNHLLPKLIPINPKQRSIIHRHPIRGRRISKVKSQRHIIILRQIQLEGSLVERHTSFRNSFLWVARGPESVGGIREMETLSLGEEAAFVDGAAGFVGVLLALEVAGYFPGDVGEGVRGEGVS